MNYKISARNRKIRSRILKMFKFIRFKTITLSYPARLIILSWIIQISSLFFDWLSFLSGWVHFSAFHSISGNIWYIIIISSIFTLFLTISNRNKEKLKITTPIAFNEYNLIIGMAILNILLAFIIFSFIKWSMQYFSANIIYGEWILIFLVWSIFHLIWGIALLIKSKRDSKTLYTNEISKTDEEDFLYKKDLEDKNMKLPF